jgi:myo-inositol 2-dehydrogenase / D-chiro-inositol 1-dehydrogenase
MGASYAEAFAQLPGVTLSAVADFDRDRAAVLASAHGARAFASIEELIDAEAADAVALALPDFDHRAGAVACLDAGLDVLCEKPLATTREDCLAIVEAERRSSATLMVNYGNRHRPAARMLRERIRGGELGDVQVLAIKGHEQWTKTRTLRWRDRTDPTWFLVSHLVDMVLWLTGSRIVSVFGQGATGHPETLDGVTGPNSVSYLAELDNGAHATMSCSWILPAGFSRGGHFACEVIGTGGAAAVDFTESGIRFYDQEKTSEPAWDWDTRDFDEHLPGWWFTSTRYFVTCVRQRTAPEPSAVDGMRVSAVLSAMSQSLDSGRAEAVPDWEETLR